MTPLINAITHSNRSNAGRMASQLTPSSAQSIVDRTSRLFSAHSQPQFESDRYNRFDDYSELVESVALGSAKIGHYQPKPRPSLGVFLYGTGIAGPETTQKVAGVGAKALNFLISTDPRIRQRFPGGTHFSDLAQPIKLDRSPVEAEPVEKKVATADHPNINRYSDVLEAQSELRGKLFSQQPNFNRKTLLIGGDHGGSLAHIHSFMAKQLSKYALEANIEGVKNHPLYFNVNDEGLRRFWCNALNSAATQSQQVCALILLVEEGVLSLSAVNDFKRACPLLFIDAHADLHTPKSSPSKNFHGMVLATALGHGAQELVNPLLSPNNAALLTQRDVESAEEQHIKKWGLHYFPCVKDSFDFRQAYREAWQRLDQDAYSAIGTTVKGAHLEFDADALDARFVPSTGTPVGTGSSRNPNVGPDLATVADTLYNVIEDVESISLMEVGYNVDSKDISTVLNMKTLADAMLGVEASDRI